MARIEQVDLDGTTYDVGKIASASDLGVVKIGTGINVTSAGVISANIPTVNNGTLTIQKNGTNVQTFTANQSSNATANITVPTKTSDLTNDSNFVESSDLATVATSGSYNDLSSKPTIPAAQVNSDWNASSGVAKILNKPTIPEIKYTTNGSNKTSVSSLIFAGNNSSSTPYGYPTFSDGYEQQWSYIRASSFTSSISAAYIGAYIYDSTESWWSGKKEARLALYSDLSGKANTSDLVTSVSSASTDSQYPSAKLFYDTVGDVETILQTLNNGGGAQ